MTELIKELENFLGIEEIAFDEQGLYSLKLQDRDILMIRYDAANRRLVMAAEIQKVEALSLELLVAALGFNFNRLAISGAWLSLDNDTQTLFLADEFFLEVVDKKLFRERLTLFFQNYLACQGIFSEEAVESLLNSESQPLPIGMEHMA